MIIPAFLKNIQGEIEIGRVLLAGSGLAGIVTPIVFEFLDMYHNTWHFDVTAWCVAYPGGLAALNGIGVFAIGKKEKDVAAARATDAITAQQVQTTAASAPGGAVGQAAQEVAGVAQVKADEIKGTTK